MTDRNSISLQTREASYFFPLYLYPEKTELEPDQPARIPNLNSAIVQQIADGLGMGFAGEDNPLPSPPPPGEGVFAPPPSGGRSGGGAVFTPLNLLDYIYAVLHSPSYRETYKEFLKIDFPRVPYPADAAEFWRLVKLGEQLRRLHLLETKPEKPCIFPATGNNTVNKPHYKDNRVYINPAQYFEGVPQTTWEFYIGGYQPAQKWLKDRNGKVLDYEDIALYQNTLAALQETKRIMGEIDRQSPLP